MLLTFTARKWAFVIQSRETGKTLQRMFESTPVLVPLLVNREVFGEEKTKHRNRLQRGRLQPQHFSILSLPHFIRCPFCVFTFGCGCGGRGGKGIIQCWAANGKAAAGVAIDAVISYASSQVPQPHSPHLRWPCLPLSPNLGFFTCL